MIKQRNTTTKTATDTITVAEMGDIICNSTNAQEYTLPAVSSGLWYRFSNANSGLVTIKKADTTTLETLNQDEQCTVLNDGSDWYAFTGGGGTSEANYYRHLMVMGG